MKKGVKYIIKIFLLIIIFYFIFGISYKKIREKKLIKQGNEIVNKIEIYKKKYNKLPDSLEEIGLKSSEEGPLYYNKWDSINYMVSFGTSLGESKIYYSDTKKWENYLRGFNSNYDKKDTIN